MTKYEYMRRIIRYAGYHFDVDADWFICNFCGQSFPNEDMVIEHLKREHPELTHKGGE